MRGSRCLASRDAAAAYDAIASSYDDLLAGDGWMRAVLWSRYARLFRAGERVLDVGCGTGEDALFLAGQGVSVLGIDVSAAMIERLREKVAGERASGRVEGRVMDLGDLSSLPDGSFDGVVSAFAGLSSTSGLAQFAAEAARVLRPGGRVMVHMLNRFSAWEWLGALRRGGWGAAAKVGAGAEREFSIGGTPVWHYLYSPGEAYLRFFQPHFVLVDAFALGCLRPPHTVRRVPLPVAGALGRLEGVVGRRRPFLNWGRFFVLEMRKR